MGRVRKYTVSLSDEEQRELEFLIARGHHSSSEILHSHILLKVSAGWSNPKITESFSVSGGTISNVCKSYCEGGLSTAIYRKRRETPPREYRLDGDQEAHLIALACSESPEGYSRWTLRLLAEHLVRLEIVDHICPETVRKTLKKMHYSLTSVKNGAFQKKKMLNL